MAVTKQMHRKKQGGVPIMVRRLSARSKSLAALAARRRQNIASLLFSKVQHFDQQQPGQTVFILLPT